MEIVAFAGILILLAIIADVLVPSLFDRLSRKNKSSMPPWNGTFYVSSTGSSEVVAYLNAEYLKMAEGRRMLQIEIIQR